MSKRQLDTDQGMVMAYAYRAIDCNAHEYGRRPVSLRYCLRMKIPGKNIWITRVKQVGLKIKILAALPYKYGTSEFRHSHWAHGSSRTGAVLRFDGP